MTEAPSTAAVPLPRVLESDCAVQRELAHKLALREKFSTCTSFLGYGFQAFMLRDLVAAPLLWAWFAALAVLEALNWLVAHQLVRQRDDDAQRRKWLRVLPVTLFMASCTWGMSALMPGVDLAVTTANLNLLLLAVVVIISVHNLCFSAAALVAFVFGMGTPLFIYGLMHPWGPSGLLALGAFVLCVMVQFYGRAAHRLEVNDICHRLESELMAAELQRTNIELNVAMDKIRIMASHDALTQCLNRRAVMEHLESEKARAGRHGERFGVILLDLDHFKSINDTYGHGVGDAVLVAMADRLRAHVRPSDSLARWGGEEFLCVMAHVDDASLLAKAEDLRRALAEAPLVQEPKALTVTASIGVAMFAPGQTIDETIDRADQALYQAKHGGRNRVCVLHSAQPLPVVSV